MATHQQVAIRWIAGHDTSAKGYAVFFEGDTIYSYGHHFAIARIVKTDTGTVCLFNSEGYSVSTAKHKTIVRRELARWRPAMPVLEVPFVRHAERMHEVNYRDLCRRAAEALDKAKRARVYRAHWESVASGLMADSWQYASAFQVSVFSEAA